MDDERDPSAGLRGTGEGLPEPEADDAADRAAAASPGPSDAERRGLGDIGELGDAASTGQTGWTDPAPSGEIPDSTGSSGTMAPDVDYDALADVERSLPAEGGGGEPTEDVP